MSYEQLSEPIRRYIRDKRWESLRPIQAAAISRILTTDDNYILASRTASGKTEAAFLPILSMIDFREKGVQVLYISPLIALINDQFVRVEELCKYLDVTVTKWHGEANRTLKERLTRDPSGILLITPESLEAMFVNKPYYLAALFSNLKFIVIDEIHSFIGSDRGIHLRSLISRIRQKSQATRIRTIGLSATIGDYDEAKRFTGEEEKTKVLLDRTKKEISAVFKFIQVDGNELPGSMIEELYEFTKDRKVLIFPNSRGRAEEIAVKLKKVAERMNGHAHYFSHHSSIDRELRAYIEEFAKNNKRENFCIVCTSTLELGIDIGTVDLVVQIDATFSVSSLIQRIGRSGRTDGATSNLLLYATNEWDLLQSVACWELYKEGFVEPFVARKRPMDILFHQVLSVLKERSGLNRDALMACVACNAAFLDIPPDSVRELIDHMIGQDYIEDLQRELIVGIEGERLTNNKSFYSVFETEDKFKVIYAGKPLGDIPHSQQVVADENILLAARVWKIKDVDMKGKRIEVVPAKDGRKPLFFGSGGDVHNSVRQKMLALLYIPGAEEEMHESAAQALTELRSTFKGIEIDDYQHERPVLQDENMIGFYAFSGTRLGRTLHFMFGKVGAKILFDDACSMFEMKASEVDLDSCISRVGKELTTIDELIDDDLRNDHLFKFSKWGNYLPDKFKKDYLVDYYFDPAGLTSLLNNLRLKRQAQG